MTMVGHQHLSGAGLILDTGGENGESKVARDKLLAPRNRTVLPLISRDCNEHSSRMLEAIRGAGSNELYVVQQTGLLHDGDKPAISEPGPMAPGRRALEQPQRHSTHQGHTRSAMYRYATVPS